MPHDCLILAVLCGLAEFERELIQARTVEGRERTKARCVKMRHRREAGEAVRQISPELQSQL